MACIRVQHSIKMKPNTLQNDGKKGPHQHIRWGTPLPLSPVFLCMNWRSPNLSRACLWPQVGSGWRGSSSARQAARNRHPPPSGEKSDVSVIFGHLLVGKLNFGRSTNLPNLPNLLNLLVLAAHVAALPAPWPQQQRWWPTQGPTEATHTPLLPLLPL